MSQNITLLGANYPDVPAVELPKTGGGTASFTDVTDSTVTSGAMLSGVTAYNSGGSKITGGIQSQDAQIIIPGTADQTIAAGKYLSGIQTIKGDSNLIAANIASGITIFGITGVFEGGIVSTDAFLRVQAPAGSTVTITKGSVTITGSGHESSDDHTMYDYYFIIHQSQFDSENPWTVTATLGSTSKNATIIIDTPDEYDILISYRLYLCQTGQWNTSLAGNLTAVASRVDGGSGGGVARTPSISYQSEYINVTEDASGDWYGGLAYGYNAVDKTGYTTAYLYCNAWGNIKRFCIWNGRPTNPSTSYRVAYVDVNGTNTFSINIANLTGSLFYFGVYVCKAQWSGAGISIYDMYLDN